MCQAQTGTGQGQRGKEVDVVGAMRVNRPRKKMIDERKANQDATGVEGVEKKKLLIQDRTELLPA